MKKIFQRILFLLIYGLFLTSLAPASNTNIFLPPQISWENISVIEDDYRRNQIINDSLDLYERKSNGKKSYPDLERINSAKITAPNANNSLNDQLKNSSSSSRNGTIRQIDETDENFLSENEYQKSPSDTTSESNLNLIQTGIEYDNTVHKSPRFYLETVLPLSQSPDKTDTFFTHDRLSSKADGNVAFSGGLGYRRLMLDNNLLLGTNTFFDYQTSPKHYRTSVGVEMKTKTLEANANYYFALSPERTVKDTLLVDVTEKAVDGFDAEVGGPLPYVPWFKLYQGYTKFYHESSEDEKSWKQRAEISAGNFFTIDAERYNKTINDVDYRIGARFTLAFDSFEAKDLWYSLKFSKKPYPDIDLTQKTLDRVQRNFNIAVERKTIIDETVVGNLTNIQLVIRFPGSVCSFCSDGNTNGVVDSGEGFEADVFVTNLSSQPSTTMSYSNATVSSGFITSNDSGILADAAAGGTSITNTTTDLDINIPSTIPNGTPFTISFDFTANGETQHLTFGPLTVGSITNGQTVDLNL